MAGILKVDQVQSDSNLSFQVAGANVAYMNSTGLQMTGGQIIAGSNTLLTASGLIYANAGIAFPATQVSSADGNTLDDYEEGTWTPTVVGSSTAGTYTPSSVRTYYTKVGNQVTLYGGFGFSAASGGSGYAQIGGLPFAYKSSSACVGGVLTNNFNFTTSTPAGISIQNTTSASSTTLYIGESVDNSSTVDAPVSGITTSTQIFFTITYTVS